MMQSYKCFSGNGAYAKASAELMIAQIALMTVDVILSMLAFYFQNTFSFAAVNENAELGYLAIRLSQTGHFGMRATHFLDFVTLATPFVLSVHEIGVMSKFVQQQAAPPTKSRKSKMRRGAFAVIVALLATIVGSVLLSQAVHAGFVAECPAISNQFLEDVSPPTENNIFLPPGVFCKMWDFDFYLDPPCSCTYLDFDNHIDGKKSCTAPALEDPDHRVLDPVMRFIQDAQFMNVVWSKRCPIIKEDLQLIASFGKLSYLRFRGGLFPDGMGPEFARLINLRGIKLVGPLFDRIDMTAMRSWRKLESFVCNNCNNLLMSDELLEAALNWPRLETLRLEGVPVCPSNNNDITGYMCFDNSLPQTCEGVDELFFRGFVGDMNGRWGSGRGATLTRCVQPACDIRFNEHVARDVGNDGLRGYGDGGWMRTMSEAGFKCMVQHSHEAALASGILSQSDLDLYPREEVEQGLTYYETIAWNTDGYLTCRDCGYEV